MAKAEPRVCPVNVTHEVCPNSQVAGFAASLSEARHSFLHPSHGSLYCVHHRLSYFLSLQVVEAHWKEGLERLASSSYAQESNQTLHRLF